MALPGRLFCFGQDMMLVKCGSLDITSPVNAFILLSDSNGLGKRLLVKYLSFYLLFNASGDAYKALIPLA